MIRFEDVSVTYVGAPRPALWGVNLHIDEGEMCLVVGAPDPASRRCCRRSTDWYHFTGGTLAGRVTVASGHSRSNRPRDLADVVGVVGQNPLAGFVTDVVEDELAYGMESLGLPAHVMRRRVEEILDLLGLTEPRDRPLRTLSAGQRQRVAVGPSSRLTHACWYSTNPRPPWTRRPPRRYWPRCNGWSTISPSPWSSPSTGWSASCSTPIGSCTYLPAEVRSWPVIPWT